MMIRKIIVIQCLLLACILASAQIKISGKVLDDTNQPLPGVNIHELGTKNGTITDKQGKYVLKVTDSNSRVIASFIGLKSKTQTVGKLNIIDFTLESDSKQLNEVVSIGYGTMRKSDLTGSISSVKVKDVETTPVVSVDQLIKGKSSGVYVNTASAEPGGVSTVRIRGVNSLSADNEPLYVIDGIAMDNVGSNTDSFGKGGVQSSNPLSYLSPQDILNIEILKDASATAIYGSRGSNGVVLITTKTGQIGKVKVNLTASTSVSTIRKRIDMLSGPDFARYRNEVVLNGGLQPIYGLTETTKPDNLQWKNWQDEILQTGISENSRLSVSGGSNTSNFYLSLGFDNNEGIIKNTNFTKGDVRFNYNADLSSKIKMSLGLSNAIVGTQMTQTTGTGGGTNQSAIRSMISKSPITTYITNATASDAILDLPIAWVNDYKDDNSENVFSGKLGLSYQISKIFKYELKASYNSKLSERYRYYSKTLSYGANGGAAGYTSFNYSSYNLDNLINFNYKINKKNLVSGVVGVTYSSSEYRTKSSAVSGFPDDLLGYEQYGSATVMGPLNMDHSIVLLNSYLARFNYTISDRYLFTLSGRVDGSSKFAKGHRYGTFPAAAFAWRIKEEPFMKNNELFSNLKLRLGWGQTGNQGISAYATQAKYGYPYTTFYPYGTVNTLGLPLWSLANTSLTWETSEQYNAGVDIGFLGNRLNFNIDVYSKVNSDMLIKKDLPASAGLVNGNTIVNFGSLSNKGVDLTINAIIFDKKFKWTVDGNISLYRNKILNLGVPVSEYGYVQYMGAKVHTIGDLQQPVNTFVEGKAAGIFWGYKTLGVFQNQAQIDAFTAQNTKSTDMGKYYFNRAAKPGDIIYQDTNHDGIISTADYSQIGDPNPDFTWGFNTNLSYENWSLALNFVGVQGKDVFNANLNTENQLTGGYWNVRQAAWDGRWRGEGTSNYYPVVSTSTIVNVISDRLVEDASYLRLANVTLSYMFKFKNTALIKDTKIFVTGNNLLTLTKYSGFDPEVDSFVGDPLRVGIDNNSYPSSKSIIFGINVNF